MNNLDGVHNVQIERFPLPQITVARENFQKAL
jgi:hypothetical protein